MTPQQVSRVDPAVPYRFDLFEESGMTTKMSIMGLEVHRSVPP